MTWEVRGWPHSCNCVGSAPCVVCLIHAALLTPLVPLRFPRFFSVPPINFPTPSCCVALVTDLRPPLPITPQAFPSPCPPEFHLRGHVGFPHRVTLTSSSPTSIMSGPPEGAPGLADSETGQ